MPKLHFSMQALRALEAAQRRRSFTGAADELNLTHGAVSHHLRAMETHLGITLFTRSGREMMPSEAASRLAERVRAALREIDEAFGESVTDSPRVQLQLSVVSDLANSWLVRRLPDFSKSHPDVALTMLIHPGLASPNPHGVDVGVWHERIRDPAFISEKTLGEDVCIAVCSPALLNPGQLPQPADTLRLPLLRFAHRSWHDWFIATGLDGREPDDGSVFDDAGLLLQAAVEGLGVALARRRLAGDLLAAGRLVQIGDVTIPVSMEYFVSWRAAHPKSAAIRRFVSWLNAALADDAARANGARSP